MEENEGATLLFAIVAQRMGKIEDEAERIGWDEPINMLSEIFYYCSEDKKTDIDLTKIYEFLSRFYYRIKKMNEKEPLNTISKTTRLENHQDIPMFSVNNYDFKMYKWCLQKKCLDYLDNKSFLVPEFILTPAEKKHFEEHCK